MAQHPCMGCSGSVIVGEESSLGDPYICVFCGGYAHRTCWRAGQEPCPNPACSSKNSADPAVDHPPHYTFTDPVYEVINVIEAWDLGFHAGNAVKYIARAGRKGAGTERQDLEKARWYINRAIDLLLVRDEPAQLAPQQGAVWRPGPHHETVEYARVVNSNALSCSRCSKDVEAGQAYDGITLGGSGLLCFDCAVHESNPRTRDTL